MLKLGKMSERKATFDSSALFLTALLSVACTTSATHMRMLENAGVIQTDVAKDSTYDYEVKILNKKILAWDGGKREDREKILKAKFGSVCNEINILDETSKNVIFQNGDSGAVWILKVKCSK